MLLTTRDMEHLANIRAQQPEMAQYALMAFKQELLDNTHHKMYQTLVDIARYLGSRSFRSEGEELILCRCKEAISMADGE